MAAEAELQAQEEAWLSQTRVQEASWLGNLKFAGLEAKGFASVALEGLGREGHGR